MSAGEGTTMCRVYMMGEPHDSYYWAQGSAPRICAKQEDALKERELMLIVNHDGIGIFLNPLHVRKILPEPLTLETIQEMAKAQGGAP